MLAAVKPDLILLDISMPEVGGIPVCNEIKRNPATASVAIVIVSAHSDASFVAATLGAGASDYVVKPFQPSDLVRRVQKVLQSRQQTPA